MTNTAELLSRHFANTLYMTPEAKALTRAMVELGAVKLDEAGRIVRGADRRATVRNTPDRRQA